MARRRSAAWKHTERIVEMFRGGKMTYTEIAHALCGEGVSTTRITVREVLKSTGEPLSRGARKSPARQHETRIVEMRKSGMFKSEIQRALAEVGIKCSKETISDIVAKNTPTKLERVITEAAKPIELPKFQEEKEYQLSFRRNANGGDKATTREEAYIFLGESGGAHRKYPLYLFRHKAAGWREAFTPMQLAEVGVSAR